MNDRITELIKLKKRTDVEELKNKTAGELCEYTSELRTAESRLALVFEIVSSVTGEENPFTHDRYDKFSTDMTISELLEHINLLENRIMEAVEIIKARKF